MKDLPEDVLAKMRELDGIFEQAGSGIAVSWEADGGKSAIEVYPGKDGSFGIQIYRMDYMTAQIRLSDYAVRALVSVLIDSLEARSCKGAKLMDLSLIKDHITTADGREGVMMAEHILGDTIDFFKEAGLPLAGMQPILQILNTAYLDSIAYSSELSRLTKHLQQHFSSTAVNLMKASAATLSEVLKMKYGKLTNVRGFLVGFAIVQMQVNDFFFSHPENANDAQELLEKKLRGEFHENFTKLVEEVCLNSGLITVVH